MDIQDRESLSVIAHPARAYTSPAFPHEQARYYIAATVDHLGYMAIDNECHTIKPIVWWRDVHVKDIRVGDCRILSTVLFSNYSNQLMSLGKLHHGDRLVFHARIINDSPCYLHYKMTYISYPKLINNKNEYRAIMPRNDDNPRECMGLACKLSNRPKLMKLKQVKDYDKWRDSHSMTHYYVINGNLHLSGRALRKQRAKDIKNKQKMKEKELKIKHQEKADAPKIKCGNIFFHHVIMNLDSDSKQIKKNSLSVKQMKWLVLRNFWTYIREGIYVSKNTSFSVLLRSCKYITYDTSQLWDFSDKCKTVNGLNSLTKTQAMSILKYQIKQLYEDYGIKARNAFSILALNKCMRHVNKQSKLEKSKTRYGATLYNNGLAFIFNA